jgi:hypothetical protein
MLLQLVDEARLNLDASAASLLPRRPPQRRHLYAFSLYCLQYISMSA